jgi:outer membrane biosynthesis protein TonB
MIRRLFFPIAAAAGLAFCWAHAAAPAAAKDKPAAEIAPGDAKTDKKKAGKADAKSSEAEKPADAKKGAAKGAAASKPSDPKKADAKKSAEAKKPEPDRSEPAAKDAKTAKGKPAKDAKSDKEKRSEKEKVSEKEKGPAKPPVAVGSYGDWNAMTAHGQGKDKTCYALAEPKDRQPAKLQRDKGYIFISSRPGEGVRNEVAIILGFPLKDGGAASAEIDGAAFELVTKGTNAWVKNPAKEKEFVDALRSGSKLVVKAPSTKGNVTTDIYSLKGLSDALGRVQKECQ